MGSIRKNRIRNIRWYARSGRLPKGDIVNAKELAALLNGREYMSEVTEHESREAKDAGLVIVHGYSDDNMEFDGAIHDEVSCYDGGKAYLTPAGLLYNECDNDECPHYEKLKAKAATITANWDSEGYSWTYTTSIPHETFEIMEDGEKYCRGIVFALADVQSATQQ
jgi:hypothetical protein